MIKTVFPERIRRLRREKNLSMDKLAQALSIKKGRINMWENNGILPRGEMLLALSSYFGVTIDYLLGNEKMTGSAADNKRLRTLQKNLERLDDANLQKAEKVLQVMFEGVFEHTCS